MLKSPTAASLSHFCPHAGRPLLGWHPQATAAGATPCCRSGALGSGAPVWLRAPPPAARRSGCSEWGRGRWQAAGRRTQSVKDGDIVFGAITICGHQGDVKILKRHSTVLKRLHRVFSKRFRLITILTTMMMMIMITCERCRERELK